MQIFNSRGLLCKKAVTPFGIHVEVLGSEKPEQLTLPVEKQHLLSPRMFYPNSRSPRIPGHLWDEVIKLFRHYCKSGFMSPIRVNNPELSWINDLTDEGAETNEVAVSFAYSPATKEYRAVVSTQSVSSASVNGDRTVCLDLMTREVCPFPPQGFEEIGSSHSHNTMGSFYSGTDDLNEVGKPGYHIVVGNIKSDSYTAVASLMYKGLRYYTTIDNVVDLSTSVQEVDETGVCESSPAVMPKQIPTTMWHSTVSLGNLNNENRTKVLLNSLAEEELHNPDDFKSFIKIEEVGGFVEFLKAKGRLAGKETPKSSPTEEYAFTHVDVIEKVEQNIVEIVNRFELDNAQELVELVGPEWLMIAAQQEVIDYLTWCGIEKREAVIEDSMLDVLLQMDSREDCGLLEACLTELQKENKFPFICGCLSYHLDSAIDSEAHLRYDHRVVDYVKTHAGDASPMSKEDLESNSNLWWEPEDEDFQEADWSDFEEPSAGEVPPCAYDLSTLKDTLLSLKKNAGSSKTLLYVMAALVDTRVLDRNSPTVKGLPGVDEFAEAYDDYLNSVFN